MSDEEMLTYCKHADDEIMRTCVSILARRYESSLLNYIYRMVRDRDIAEDLLQETFVRIYRKSREYRPQLTLNLPVDSTGSDAEELVRLLESEDTQVPARLVADKELGRVVGEILGELPESYRVVLILCDMEGFSYREASEVMNVRPGTVGSRLARARQHFAGKMLPYMRRVKK